MPLLWSFIFYDLLWGYQFRTSSHFRDDSVTCVFFGDAKQKHLNIFYQQGACGERCNKYEKFPNYITRLRICPLYIFRKTNKATDGTTMDIKKMGESRDLALIFSGPNIYNLFIRVKLGIGGLVHGQLVAVRVCLWPPDRAGHSDPVGQAFHQTIRDWWGRSDTILTIL